MDVLWVGWLGNDSVELVCGDQLAFSLIPRREDLFSE